MIPVHIAVLNSIAPMLLIATVFPSRYIAASDRKTAPWQTMFVHHGKKKAGLGSVVIT